MNFKSLLALTILPALFISGKPNNQNDSNSLLAADRYYSALSAEKGRNAAFLALFDSEGVMLTSNRPPVEGHAAISKLLLSRTDTTYTLTWEPSLAKVAKSGELGYTYGIYKLTARKTNKLLGE